MSNVVKLVVNNRQTVFIVGFGYDDFSGVGFQIEGVFASKDAAQQAAEILLSEMDWRGEFPSHIHWCKAEDDLDFFKCGSAVIVQEHEVI